MGFLLSLNHSLVQIETARWSVNRRKASVLAFWILFDFSQCVCLNLLSISEESSFSALKQKLTDLLVVILLDLNQPGFGSFELSTVTSVHLKVIF